MVNDSLLLLDLKSGDEAAFKYFYDKYHLPLYRRLLKLVQVDVIAEELLQDLFLKIWQKRELIDPSRSFQAYLYRIAENMVVDHYRKLAREVKVERETDLNELILQDLIEEDFSSDRFQNIISKAIEQLPPQQQVVFKLCKIEEKSYAEVSELLNISQATINTHITRASKTIKAYILKNHNGMMILAGVCMLSEQAAL